MTITERAQKVLTEIDAARALAEKATTRPWESGDYSRLGDFPNVKVKTKSGDICSFCQALPGNDENDAAFIAAACNGHLRNLNTIETAIRGLLEACNTGDYTRVVCLPLLTTLCDQREASR